MNENLLRDGSTGKTPAAALAGIGEEFLGTANEAIIA
jgi:hypothetical protein